MSGTIMGYPDLTEDTNVGGLPPSFGRRNFTAVVERLADLPEGQWAVVEVAEDQHRANSIRKSFNKTHPEVAVSQRRQEDGTILVFVRLRGGQQ